MISKITLLRRQIILAHLFCWFVDFNWHARCLQLSWSAYQGLIFLSIVLSRSRNIWFSIFSIVFDLPKKYPSGQGKFHLTATRIDTRFIVAQFITTIWDVIRKVNIKVIMRSIFIKLWFAKVLLMIEWALFVSTSFDVVKSQKWSFDHETGSKR